MREEDRQLMMMALDKEKKLKALANLKIIDPHQPGAKLDQGKNRLGLVLGDFSRALQAVGMVGTLGASKYTDHGWIKVENGINRYTDALYRHLLKHSEGECLDPETGLPHLAHIAWNSLAVLEFYERSEIIK